MKADSNGLISAAGTGELGIGVATEAIPASGSGTVKLWTAPGSFFFKAASAVHAGDNLYSAASGEVDDDTGGTDLLPFVARQDAAAGDIFEGVRSDSATTSTVHTFAAADIGTIVAAGSNQGTTGSGMQNTDTWS